MKQQLQLQQKSKDLLYECSRCNSRHVIKEMLRWPVNTVIDSYLKELAVEEGGSNMVKGKVSEALLDVEDDPNLRQECERCEEAKPKLVCYDCGVFGSALCKECSGIVHFKGTYLKHKIVAIGQKKN